MAKTSIGLVIRERCVELLVLKGKKVVSSTRAPIEGNQPQHLSEAVVKLMGSAGLKTKKLAVSVEHPDVLFRYFTLPTLPKPEWETAVQFEARKYIPFKTESLIWDYSVISTSGKPQMEVVFTAIPRTLFATLQEALTAANIQATHIEPRSLSLARLLEPAAKDAPPNEFVCLVAVDQAAAQLAIIKDHVPYLTRDISLQPRGDLPMADPGAAAPPPALGDADPPVEGPPPLPPQEDAGAGQVPPPDAGSVEAAPPPVPPAEVPQEAQPDDSRAQRLLSELSVSMDFFMREYPATKISRVLLCGDAELVEAWGQQFSGQLFCPVEQGNQLFAAHIDGDLDPTFASAVGLLRCEKKGPRGATFDYLKRSAAKAAGAKQSVSLNLSAAELTQLVKTPQAAWCGAGALAFLVLLWGVGSVQVGSARSQVQQLINSRAIVGWNLHTMSTESLEPIKGKAESQLALLSAIMEQPVSISSKMDALARSLPEGMWLSDLLFTDPITDMNTKRSPSLTVKGACLLGDFQRDLDTIQQFAEQMKSHPTFLEGVSNAQLGNINELTGIDPGTLEQYTYRSFQLNCSSKKVL